MSVNVVHLGKSQGIFRQGTRGSQIEGGQKSRGTLPFLGGKKIRAGTRQGVIRRKGVKGEGVPPSPI